MKDKPSWIIGGALIVAAVVAGIAVHSSTAAGDAPAPFEPPAGTLSAVDARDALGRAPTLVPGATFPKYDRNQFGKPWLDVDRNGCDTRDDILVRDARRAGGTVTTSGRCTVATIEMTEPYAGKHVTSKSALDIDHVVPLSVAWRSGAWTWAAGKRTELANDPRNLLAVDDQANQHAKGDKTPDAWLPAAPAQCEYGRMYATVISIYSLPVSSATRGTLTTVLATCP